MLDVPLKHRQTEFVDVAVRGVQRGSGGARRCSYGHPSRSETMEDLRYIAIKRDGFLIPAVPFVIEYTLLRNNSTYLSIILFGVSPTRFKGADGSIS
jgi:hypothetical protein